jgi:hypothetical protein
VSAASGHWNRSLVPRPDRFPTGTRTFVGSELGLCVEPTKRFSMQQFQQPFDSLGSIGGRGCGVCDHFQRTWTWKLEVNRVQIKRSRNRMHQLFLPIQGTSDFVRRPPLSNLALFLSRNDVSSTHWMSFGSNSGVTDSGGEI